MIYSLIPAKVISSRLPFKNTFKFLLKDKPLIFYTIDAVNYTGIKPNVFTDEEDIKYCYGANIVGRNENISGLQTTMKETVSAFIKKMGIKDTDTILLTYLTCPFRTGESIKKAISLFKRTGAKSLQSITAVDYRPYGLMKQTNENKFTCLQSQKNYYQKQNTPTLYKANGAIYIFKVSELKYLKNQMFNSDTIGYKLNEIEGLDIDTEFDLMVAEKILERTENERLTYKLPDTRSKTKFSTTWGMLHLQRGETSRA